MPLIPALGRQRQADLFLSSRPAWSTCPEFQDSQDYTEKPYLDKNKTTTTTKKNQNKKQNKQKKAIAPKTH
jgi:hypothetical protein